MDGVIVFLCKTGVSFTSSVTQVQVWRTPCWALLELGWDGVPHGWLSGPQAPSHPRKKKKKNTEMSLWKWTLLLCCLPWCPPQKERETEIRKVTGRLRLGSHVNRPQRIMVQVKGQMSQSGSERRQSSSHAWCQHWDFTEWSTTVHNCNQGSRLISW